VIGKAYRNPGQWKQVGQPRIDHHAAQLGQFRAFSNRRDLLLCRNYMYLRDGQSCGFQDQKLLSKLTEKLMDHVYRLEGPNPANRTSPESKEPRKWSCTHCHGEFHEGGSTKCDLKDENTRVARLMAKKIDARLASGDTDKTKVIKEVREAS
jgi:hypothetical protein